MRAPSVASPGQAYARTGMFAGSCRSGESSVGLGPWPGIRGRVAAQGVRWACQAYCASVPLCLCCATRMDCNQSDAWCLSVVVSLQYVLQSRQAGVGFRCEPYTNHPRPPYRAAPCCGG